MSAHRIALNGLTLLAILWPSPRAIIARQAPVPPANIPDAGQQVTVPSGRDFIIERIETSVRFEANGTSEQQLGIRVRPITDAAIQRFTQVVFVYDSSLGWARFEHVEVRKPAGQVIRVESGAVKDSAVQAIPNVLTDLHQLQAAVPALALGDVVDYLIAGGITRPQIPGHFWLQHRFTTSAVVNDETLTIDVPAGRVVQLKTAAGFDPTTPGREENHGRRVYRWKRTNPSIEENRELTARALAGRLDPPDVQVTTFRSWDEIAQWYREAVGDREEPDATIQAKAEELTRGLTTSADKIRALYDFVATQYRYLSLSFGSGLLIPHRASEVLANRYGDCKDRHTLLAALARAVGIHLYPAIVSSTQLCDRAVPSLAQFDHMITVAALGPAEQDWVWLDTSPGVAPFGWISPTLRDKTAVVFMTDGRAATPGASPGLARLATTPAVPPVPSYSRLHVDARLSDLGTLDARVTIELRGDPEVLVRKVLRALGAAGQIALLKGLANGLQLTGDLTETSTSALESTRDPLLVKFRARRENWFDRSMNAPLVLPLGRTDLSYAEDEDWQGLKKVRPWLLPSEFLQSALIDLPAQYVARVPLDVSVLRDYAQYRSTYKIEGSRLSAERVLTVTAHDLPFDRMRDYLAFVAAVRADEAQKVEVDTTKAATAVAPAEASQTELYAAGLAAFRKNDFKGAIDLWKRVVAIDPRHRSAWDAMGLAHTKLAQWPEAVAALQEQVKVEPYHNQAWGDLGWALQHVNRRAEATAAYRKAIEITPLDKYAHRRLGLLLLKPPPDYREAASELAIAEQITPDDEEAVAALGRALSRMGERSKALEAYQRARKLDPAPGRLSELAYDVVDADLDIERGIEWGRTALKQAAEASLALDIKKARLDQADRSWSLSWAWHALGWAAFKKGDYATARKYLSAARSVRSDSEISAHLALVMEKLGDSADAVRFTAESLLYEDDAAVRARLRRLTGTESAAEKAIESARARVLWERGIQLARVSPKAGTLDFVAIFTNGSEKAEVRAVTEDDKLVPLLEHVRRATFPVIFPDATPARILTGGRMVCLKQGADCAALLTFGWLPLTAPRK